MSEPLPAPQEASDPQQIAMEVATFLDSKRAADIAVLFVQDLLQISSYFVVATGSSQRVLQTLGEGAYQILKKSDLPRLSVEGLREGRWICIDYGEVVIHLFDAGTRQFYALEELWGDAPRVEFQRAGSPADVTDSSS